MLASGASVEAPHDDIVALEVAVADAHLVVQELHTLGHLIENPLGSHFDIRQSRRRSYLIGPDDLRLGQSDVVDGLITLELDACRI